MIVVNFAHPLTSDHRAQIEYLTASVVEKIIDVAAHFRDEQPFAEQVVQLVQAIGLTPEEWQTEALLVNLPTFSPIAVTLLAYLHGLTGHFPAVIRLRPVAQSLVSRYEVAEILNLQALRHAARAR